MAIFVDILLVGSEGKISGTFNIHLVRQNLWNCRTDTTLLDKLIKSATFVNDFKKSSI